MKKYKYLVLFVALITTLAISANIAREKNDITTNTATEAKVTTKNQLKTRLEDMQKKNEIIREEAKQKIQNLKVKIKEEKDAVKEKIKETRITGRENALQKFDAAVARVSSLSDKINSQITKLKAKGVNVINAENFMTTAETKLADAKTKIADANILFSNSINELTADKKATLKKLTQDIQTLLNDARSALNATIKSLKEALIIKK